MCLLHSRPKINPSPSQVCNNYACTMQVFVERVAANDDHAAHQRHRTLPIAASVTPIANYPTKLRIYLTNASPFWQVRCFFRGRSYTQSLRTTNKTSAISAAKQFFHLKTAELYGAEVVTKPEHECLFQDLVSATLAVELGRVQRGEFSTASLRIFQNRLYKTIIPFFGAMPVAKIGYAQLNSFVQHLSAKGNTATTVQQHLVATRKVLNHAYAQGLIHALPKSPSVKPTSKPRGSFTLAEYRQLVRTARQQIGTQIPVLAAGNGKRAKDLVERYATVTHDLQWLIRFMVNSFIRPSDLRTLQHKHVTVVRGEHTYLRLNLPETKKHDKPIVTLQAAVHAYERLEAYYAEQHLAGPDDYLFMPGQKNRAKALEFMGWQFKYVQDVAHTGPNTATGKERTLYSLRHTAITFRLLYGNHIDLLTLARNARTSVEMIEKFYASNLDAEMNIDLLQGKRGKH